ncbi:uncharacterized protein LOC125030941 [Penaeus chinensis]|uniref:uncharacterized protein LOC125030941 n=1 Tax=Penaeus chinensis TaxID=139456 RepID=UPI001FB8053A|nr:uncharacterized protein LOC125030941 [Penaeus chinensis]
MIVGQSVVETSTKRSKKRNMENLEGESPGNGERSSKLDDVIVEVVKQKRKKKRKHEYSGITSGREDFSTNKETDNEGNGGSKKIKHKRNEYSIARSSNEDSGASPEPVTEQGKGKAENGLKKRKAKVEKDHMTSFKSKEKLEYPEKETMTNDDNTEHVGDKTSSSVIYDESGQKFKVYENGEKRKWYDIWYREDSVMTQYEKKWVKREAVPHLEKLKKEIENEDDEVTRQKLEKKYRNYRLKAGKELKAYIIKSHKTPQNTGRNEKVAVPINFEENEVMTQFQGVWVKRSAVTWLDANVKKLYASKNRENESEKLADSEVQKKIKKLLRYAHRRLRIEVIKKKLKGYGGEFIDYDESYGENKSKTCFSDENAKKTFETMDKGMVTGRKFIFDEDGDVIKKGNERENEDVDNGRMGEKNNFDDDNMKNAKKRERNDIPFGKMGDRKKIIFDDDGEAVEDIHEEKVNEKFTEEIGTSYQEEAHITNQWQVPSMNSSENLKPVKTKKPSKFLNITYNDNPDIVKSDGFYVSRKGLKRLNKLKGELSAEGMPEEKQRKILRKERQKEERLVKRKHKLRTEEKEENDKSEWQDDAY